MVSGIQGVPTVLYLYSSDNFNFYTCSWCQAPVMAPGTSQITLLFCCNTSDESHFICVHFLHRIKILRKRGI